MEWEYYNSWITIISLHKTGKTVLQIFALSFHDTIKHYHGTMLVMFLIGLKVWTFIMFKQKWRLKLYVNESIGAFCANKKLLIKK